MIANQLIRNPKALNLDVLKKGKAKVTIGFKCHPSLKLELAENAEKIGLTLSEYIESLVTNYEKFAIKEKEGLIKKIQFYECDILKSLYELYKNKTVPYLNSKNETVNVTIKNVEDVFTIIINSFKISEDND